MSNRHKMSKLKLHIFGLLPFFLLLFFTFSFLYRSDLSFDQDLGRHLKLGEIIWATKHVPQVNLFSYTNPNFPFINHHWLFEVIAYLASISIGLEALLMMKVFMLLCSVAIILLLAKRTKSALFLPISFLFLHMLRSRTELRPEIISFCFTALTMYILNAFNEKNSKLLYFLPFISLLWVNSHIYFPVGIFLQLLFLSDLLFQKFVQKRNTVEITEKLKKLSAITGLCILVSLLNPNALKGALYPFTVFSNYGVTISENQNIFTLQSIHFVDPDFLFFYLSALIVLGSIYASFWRTKFSLKDISFSLLGLALAVQSIRGFPYLLFISLPSILRICNYKISNLWTKGITILVCLLIILEATLYLNGSYYNLTYKPYNPSLTLVEDAKPALDYILKHNLPQPIFNNFDIGSYIIYRGYPKYTLFIDGRPEAYPTTFFTNTYLPMQEEYSLFKKQAKKIGFNTIIFSITDENPRTIKFFNAITRDPDWKIVFLDQFMLVLTKSSVEQQLQLQTIDLEKLNLSTYQYANVVAYNELSTFLFNTHHIAQAKIFTQKALSLSPNNPAANNAMAYILYFENPHDIHIHDYLEKSSNAIFW